SLSTPSGKETIRRKSSAVSGASSCGRRAREVRIDTEVMCLAHFPSVYCICGHRGRQDTTGTDRTNGHAQRPGSRTSPAPADVPSCRSTDLRVPPTPDSKRQHPPRRRGLAHRPAAPPRTTRPGRRCFLPFGPVTRGRMPSDCDHVRTAAGLRGPGGARLCSGSGGCRSRTGAGHGAPGPAGHCAAAADLRLTHDICRICDGGAGREPSPGHPCGALRVRRARARPRGRGPRELRVRRAGRVRRAARRGS
ncbi:hypothetical protein H180DRAFT_03580, partial [Streptomyces sp. WMMB 322]